MGRCGNALEIKNLCLSGLSEKMSLPYLQTAVETKEGGRKKTKGPTNTKYLLIQGANRN